MKNKSSNGKLMFVFHKQWYDFADEYRGLVTPKHHALYNYLIDLNNKLRWREDFAVPTYEAMDILGIKSHHTLKKTMDDLIIWRLVKPVQKSQNQHTANRYSLVILSDLDQSGTAKNATAENSATAIFTKADAKATPSATANFTKDVHYNNTNKDNIKTFLNEEVEIKFQIFCKEQKSPVSNDREEALRNRLADLANDPTDQIAIIDQAIAGGYSSFCGLDPY